MGLMQIMEQIGRAYSLYQKIRQTLNFVYTKMTITRVSPVSKKINTMDLDITQEQIDKWERGELIQNAFPNLSASQREFIKTGITDEEWDSIFHQY